MGKILRQGLGVFLDIGESILITLFLDIFLNFQTWPILIFLEHTPETCFQLDSGKNSILANFWTFTARSASKFEYDTSKFRGKPSYGVRVMSKTVRKPCREGVNLVDPFSEIRNLDGFLFF